MEERGGSMVCVSGQEDDGVIHESESDVCEAWERGGRESWLGSGRVYPSPSQSRMSR